jgi:hypothetical protein
MTVGDFLPAFLFPIFLHRWLVALADNPPARPFFLGVAAGVIGLIAAVTVDIVERGVVDVPTARLAIPAFAALMRFHGSSPCSGWRSAAAVSAPRCRSRPSSRSGRGRERGFAPSPRTSA